MTSASINESTLAKELLADINAIRGEIAASARAEEDHASYRAYLLQARHLMDIQKRITSQWADAYVQVLRETGVEPSAEDVEPVYSRGLAKFLEDHIEVTWTRFGGRAGERENSAEKPAFEAGVDALSAGRHHASVIMYCEAYADRLRDRAREIEEATPQAEASSPVRGM